MNPITLTSGNQTIQFTNADLTIDGTVYPYGSISRIWHIPQRSAFAIVSGDQTAAFTYEEKGLPLLQALLDRIAQAEHLDVEVYLPAGAQEEAPAQAAAQSPATAADPEGAGADAEAGDAAEEAGGAGRDKRFLIELGLGILLILLGIAGFILH